MDLDPFKQIRRAIWLYAALVILEGAVRKWGPPALSDPFLVIRAPVALLIYILAISKGVFPKNLAIFIFAGIAIGTAFFTMTLGHHNPLVMGYGLQYNFFHFPLIWIIAKVMDKDDVLRLGALFILISIPNSLLMVVQDVSPETALVNRGVGGSFGGQIDDGSGGIRPPGLFSFITGNNLFYPIVAAFLFSQLTEKRNLYWIFIFGGLLGLAAAIAVCGSRTMVIACGITVLAFLFSLMKKGLLNAKIFAVITTTPFAFLLLYNTFPELQQGWEAFIKRWEVSTSENYGGIEGSIFLRILAGFTNSFVYASNAPIFGYGIGMGSNVGAVLISGSMTFLLAEDEWSRIVQEMGPILGFLFISTRTAVAIGIGIKSFKALLTHKNALPLMLATTGCLAILQGQIAPPTMLGFAVLSAGITLAACKEPEEENMDEDDDDDLSNSDDPELSYRVRREIPRSS